MIKYSIETENFEFLMPEDCYSMTGEDVLSWYEDSNLSPLCWDEYDTLSEALEAFENARIYSIARDCYWSDSPLVDVLMVTLTMDEFDDEGEFVQTLEVLGRRADPVSFE